MGEEITKGQINNIVSGGLRSIAASFPGFASIGQAWSEYENCRTAQRIQELIDNLKIEVGNFNERIGNLEEKFENIADEFPSLLEIAADKVIKEFSVEKRRIYAHVLVGLAVTGEVKTYDERVALIHELEVLTPIDLKALKLFEDKDVLEVSNLRWRTLELAGDESKQLEQFASILAKLESRGLIITTSMPSSVTYVPNGMTNWSARWMDTKYKILPIGKQLLSVLD